MLPSNQQSITIPKKTPTRVYLGFFYRSATGIPILKLRLTIEYRLLGRFFCGRVRSNKETDQTSPGGANVLGDAGHALPGKFIFCETALCAF